ncbi:MAG: SufD family Fe-S cluster assembly protein [Actinobacteria bacterium]|nr:SufD family Fe-S cluster assembly protein [Actinomycetota bacterium]
MVIKTEELYRIAKLANIDLALHDPNTARIIINKNKIIDTNLVPGLSVDPKKIEDGVDINIVLAKGTRVRNPVHLCFGVTHKKAIQRILLNIEIGENSEVLIFSHCVFPNAIDVKHIMDATIRIGKGAKYSYLERHIHSEEGGVTVIPRARIVLEEGARLKTEFELLKGRVGSIDIDYETVCEKDSVMEMTAKIDGKGEDIIKIREVGNLVGEGSRGVLTSRVAVREKAKAEIYNKLVATAAFARGHVDCKEVIQGDAVASAIPIVEVANPKARVTHEASIGSVDAKELQTLMSRGLTEEEATSLIIEGLLS